MKTAGLPLLAFALAGSSLSAEDAAPAFPAKTSARLTQEISAFLPRYAPPPPPPKDFSGPDSSDSDPNVLRLPKFTVKEYRPRDHDPDVWLTNRSMQQKAMAAYKQSMTDFEWALNSWFIPLFSPPASARARGAYQSGKFRNEIGRIQDLLIKIEAVNPGTSAEIKQELRNLVEGRPAGSK